MSAAAPEKFVTGYDYNTDREIDHVFDLEIPCDYNQPDRYWTCPDSPARWVAHVRCGACGAKRQRLICDFCKDFTLHTSQGTYCGDCKAVTVPFRGIFTLIEPLNKT